VLRESGAGAPAPAETRRAARARGAQKTRELVYSSTAHSCAPTSPARAVRPHIAALCVRARREVCRMVDVSLIVRGALPARCSSNGCATRGTGPNERHGATTAPPLADHRRGGARRPGGAEPDDHGAVPGFSGARAARAYARSRAPAAASDCAPSPTSRAPAGDGRALHDQGLHHSGHADGRVHGAAAAAGRRASPSRRARSAQCGAPATAFARLAPPPPLPARRAMRRGTWAAAFGTTTAAA